MASRTETIINALTTALETAQTGTVYAPDAVQPVLFWPDEKALPVGLSTVYLVRPGRETGGPGPESCSVTENLEVFILAARRYTSPTDDPFKESPPRWKVSADLVADVKEKLRKDEKLGGEAITALAGPAGGEVDVDHERYLPKWVCPELRIVIRHRYEKDAR